MATSKAARQTGGRSINFRSSPASSSGDVGIDVHDPSQSGYIVVVMLLVILFCLLLPLMALLYFDTLTIQKKAERTEARIEKLVKSLEEKDKK